MDFAPKVYKKYVRDRYMKSLYEWTTWTTHQRALSEDSPISAFMSLSRPLKIWWMTGHTSNILACSRNGQREYVLLGAITCTQAPSAMALSLTTMNRFLWKILIKETVKTLSPIGSKSGEQYLTERVQHHLLTCHWSVVSPRPSPGRVSCTNKQSIALNVPR